MRDVLTPAHFLTGGPTLNFYDTEQDLRTRWYLSQKIFKDIWARWHTEYLTQLTARSKWSASRDNLNLNDVVIIHDANLPPGKWAMGRVVELHPGSDGLVRVVTLKTKNGYMKRPSVKLSVLPTNNENANQNSGNIKAISENAKQPQKDIKIIKKPNSTSNRCSFLSLAMSLMLFMTLLSESYGSLNVTRFKPGQKLFFDKISHMQLASDTWKTVIYYDLEPYWQGNKAINKYVDHLNESCIRMVEKEHCNVIILQLDQELAELKHYNNLLMSQHAGHAPRARRRRGIVNGVGYLANKLFGVLDQEFAEKYERDINILKHNQDHLALLWKNQTSIIEAEYNLLKRTEIGMNKQQKLINQHFIALEKEISQINQKQTGAYALVQFTLEALTATNMINSIKQIQNTLLDMVTDIYQGHFNYHILTPEQFRKELNLISSEISKDLSLPIKDIQNHLNNLYQLLGVRTRMSEQCLIFEVTIPLVSRDSFEIFNVIPIPELWNDRMVIVKPRSDYVALSLRKNAYVLMTEAEVQSCTHQDEEVSYCRTNKPVFHMKRDEDLCQAEEDSNKCLLQTSKCKDQWINIHQSNNYIYFCCEACRVRIICEDQVSSQSLTGVGILTIGHGCLVRTNQFSLQSHKPGSNIIKTKSEVVLPYISPINDVINVSSAYKLTWNESEVDYKELKDLQGRIKMMKEAEPLAGSITYHDVHHYTAIYASFGLLIVVALLAWWGHARLARLLPAAPAAAVAPPAREGPPPPPPRAAAPRAPLPQGGDPVAHCVSVVSDNMGNQCNKIKAISVDNVQVYTGAYYWKRQPGWTNLRGMWGKRAAAAPAAPAPAPGAPAAPDDDWEHEGSPSQEEA
ncbi:unnamed protein product [Plutella xylostella]|uniref:(diamondback moth) hypothetical protein n=1 Tax=Plutella xylostella TaxID=51655 RepID=A0A8S4FN01_PLUXY|nr:unnamed protein product [Plutella xylostella]